MSVLVLGVVLAWVVALAAGHQNRIINNPVNVALAAVPLAGFTVVAAATSLSTVSDRAVYLQLFRVLDQAESPRVPGLPVDDTLFVTLLWGLARVAPATETTLFAAFALLCFLGHLVAYRLLMPAWASVAAVVTVLASGLFFAYVDVAARQGVAVAALLVALALQTRGSERRLLWLALLVAASLLHWSALPLAVGLAVLRVKRPTVRAAVTVWAVLAVSFVLGLPERVLGGLERYVPEVADYTSADALARYSAGGSRLDFLAVSAAVLAVGLWGWRRTEQDERYGRLVVAYVLFNSMFLLLGWVAFSDRLAAYSWFLAPLLLWFPIANSRRPSPMLAGTAAVAAIGVGLATGALATLG